MAKSKPGLSRGVLNRKEGSKYFQVSRYQPSAELEYFIEHFWIVKWNILGNESYQQDVLSHPSPHLVFEQGNTQIWGVITGKFTRVLEGHGKVFGIKFRPAAFYPFYGKSVASFTDKKLSFEDVFDEDLASLESEILQPEEDETMVNRAKTFLTSHLPDQDPKVEEIAHIVTYIMDEPAILKVDDIVNHFNFSKRTLQRLFRKYVGVNPKWVIQRYRLHEAAEKMAEGEAENWPQLALDLGYFDQAHFIRDFKAIVGQTPAAYAQKIGAMPDR